MTNKQKEQRDWVLDTLGSAKFLSQVVGLWLWAASKGLANPADRWDKVTCLAGLRIREFEKARAQVAERWAPETDPDEVDATVAEDFFGSVEAALEALDEGDFNAFDLNKLSGADPTAYEVGDSSGLTHPQAQAWDEGSRNLREGGREPLDAGSWWPSSEDQKVFLESRKALEAVVGSRQVRLWDWGGAVYRRQHVLGGAGYQPAMKAMAERVAKVSAALDRLGLSFEVRRAALQAARMDLWGGYKAAQKQVAAEYRLAEVPEHLR